MTVLVIIAGWEVIQYRPGAIHGRVPRHGSVMVGVFAALDAVLF